MRSAAATCVLLLAASAAVHARQFQPRDLRPEQRTALDDYVEQPDAHYSFYDTGVVMKGDGYDTYVINMTSQQWLTANDVDRTIWWHYLAIVIPKKISYTRVASMYITGGDNTDGTPPNDGEDIALCAAIAGASQVPCAVLFQVPNQPIHFVAEQPPRGRSEDAIIAYAWSHFINDTSDPEWLPRLPMTKSAVRALDTIDTYMQQKFGAAPIDSFFVCGASKRGWTTWTTMAVDSRVIGAAPMVMDALNFIPNMHHFYRAYGGWSFVLSDYYDMGFTSQVDNPNTTVMTNIIDPFVYRDRFTMPKLVIDSTGDEFFMLDDNYFWWNNVTAYGETHLLMVQNAEHSLATGIPEVVQGLGAFTRDLFAGQPRPSMNWTFGTNGANNTISLTTSEKPRKVLVHHADTLNHTRRDWRLIISNDNCAYIRVSGNCIQPVLWDGHDAQKIDDTHYYASMAPPAAGWRAFFLEVTFDAPAGIIPYVFTTQVSIMPNTFPFPECYGAGCKGYLL